MYDQTYPWRYATSTDSNGHTTITRGRPYNVGDSDTWTFYWDGMTDSVAFYDEGYRGLRVADWCDPDEGKRATIAHSADRDFMCETGALKRVAQRITGNLDADFICVGLDRGIDLYVLTETGDPSGDWRREIENVNNGEVYRMETEEYTDLWGPSGWQQADDWCEEWYGSDSAEKDWHEAYPLTEFPAEVMVDASN